MSAYKWIIASSILCYIGFGAWVWNHDSSKEGQDSFDALRILGRLPESGDAFAVYSSTTENGRSPGYAFYLPMTALAWKRIGFRSIVVLAGEIGNWDTDKVLHHIKELVLELNGLVILLPTSNDRSVMVSQVSRIYVADILHSLNPDLPDFYLVTSDADLWPIAKDVFHLPRNKSIMSLHCCGQFQQNGRKYKMLPMGYIGMNASMWRRLTSMRNASASNIPDIINVFYEQFGEVAHMKVKKGQNLGWYLDQRMISILIDDWEMDMVGRSGQNVNEGACSKLRTWS